MLRPGVQGAGTAREYMVRPMPPALSADEIRDANTRYHDVAAEHYDSKWGIDFGELGLDQVTAKVRKALGREPGRYARSLEIGSGTGYFTLNLMRAGLVEHATCSDISPGHARHLAANAERLGLEVHTEAADAERLPFEDESFELVLGHAVLHHIPDLRRRSPSSSACSRPAARCCSPASRPATATASRACQSARRRACPAVASRDRRRAGAAGAGGREGRALEAVVDVHAFAPGSSAGLARAPG